MSTWKQLAALTVAFTTLMSVPFLVPHFGWVALVGLVPLLLMDRIATERGVRHFFWWYYLAFLLWNLVTTWWVCIATVGGGIFASVANALQMAVVFALFRLSKNRLRGCLPYVFLAALWIAWERWYFSAEISWPWLVLGNSFARTLTLAQWYEWTGSLGGSLWIWTVNLLLFFLIGKPRKALAVGAAAAAIIPAALSLALWFGYKDDESCGTLDVVIGQPNFDPYQKFKSVPQTEQTAVLLRLFEQGLEALGQTPGQAGDERARAGGDGSSLPAPTGNPRPVLLLAPETFTSDVVLGRIEDSPTWRTFNAFLLSHPCANILFGAATREYFTGSRQPSVLARKLRHNLWSEHHNSALITDATGRTEVFHKSRLVVGTEKTPYPKLFTKIDDKLGGVMGRDIGQPSISLLDFSLPSGNIVPLGCAVCYESVYGEYCTGYVAKGAQALTVITNDAWWGDTAGYRQHLSYSSLRAIETRREIARCANTGISAFIDARGRITARTPWWEETVLTGSIRLSDRQTFFVRNGDIPGRLCSLLALLLAAVALVLPLARGVRNANKDK